MWATGRSARRTLGSGPRVMMSRNLHRQRRQLSFQTRAVHSLPLANHPSDIFGAPGGTWGPEGRDRAGYFRQNLSPGAWTFSKITWRGMSGQDLNCAFIIDII